MEELREDNIPIKPDASVSAIDTGKKRQIIDEEEYEKGKKISQQPIILIVDDNSDIKTFLTHHFEPEYQVITARNGIEGWEIALEVVPDIILADIMMPLLDGKDFCRRIKKDERTSHIPVVMLTALGSRENQMAGIDAGADDYIIKPFDITLLKARIDNIICIRKGLRERFSKEVLLKPSEVILASPDEKFLKKVVQVIEKNIDNIEFDVDKMATSIGVSRTQLYRKIAALTNMTAKEFVRDFRLQRAAQMISQNKLNISEIALQTGFNDISYFRKCFKEKYGMSASDYARKHSSTELESV
jgi:DNA-binding response OmpR family regulator